jgi:hypothetical protein
MWHRVCQTLKEAMKRLSPYIAGVILMFGILATLRPEPHKRNGAVNMLPAAQAEIVSVVDEFNRIEADALKKASDPSLDRLQQLILLGKVLFCRSIVEAHEGRLWASSTEGPGTIFHFTLPLKLSAGS